MNHALNGSSAIRRLKHSKAIEIRDRITFDYYTGLPHMCSVLFLPVYSLFKCFRSSHACHMRPVLFLPVQSLFKCFRSSHACHMRPVLFLPVYSLFKCFRSSHACHMRPVLFLPVQSLFKCFRSSHACHMRPVLFLPVYSLFKCFRSSHACHMRPVLFLPVQSLLTCFRSSLTRFADFVSLFLTNNSSDSKAFLHFSGSPTAVHSAFLFFDVKAWPQSQTDLFTCTTVLHCGHTFLRRIDLFYSIACTMVLHCGHTFLNLS